ncbi:MAG TPA: J domain-containing protein [Thiolapillus brandeum]|uniref:J domain-containing protein n=1 Tax=Thiolapillus brandeum TaxID=1076588 RepID=A0A831NVZ2_9GAMM|nr:J domain-containing protein [Thiolapillus brandeum]
MFYIKQLLFVSSADHYRVLGVSPDASLGKIKAHHRAVIRLFDPDKNPDIDSWDDSYAPRLNEAYNTLKKPQQRAKYDRQLKARLSDDDWDVLHHPVPESSHTPRVTKNYAESPMDKVLGTWIWQRFPKLVVITGLLLILLIFIGLSYHSSNVLSLKQKVAVTPQSVDPRKTSLQQEREALQAILYPKTVLPETDVTVVASPVPVAAEKKGEVSLDQEAGISEESPDADPLAMTVTTDPIIAALAALGEQQGLQPQPAKISSDFEQSMPEELQAFSSSDNEGVSITQVNERPPNPSAQGRASDVGAASSPRLDGQELHGKQNVAMLAPQEDRHLAQPLIHPAMKKTGDQKPQPKIASISPLSPAPETVPPEKKSGLSVEDLSELQVLLQRYLLAYETGNWGRMAVLFDSSRHTESAWQTRLQMQHGKFFSITSNRRLKVQDTRWVIYPDGQVKALVNVELSAENKVRHAPEKYKGVVTLTFVDTVRGARLSDVADDLQPIKTISSLFSFFMPTARDQVEKPSSAVVTGKKTTDKVLGRIPDASVVIADHGDRVEQSAPKINKGAEIHPEQLVMRYVNLYRSGDLVGMMGLFTENALINGKQGIQYVAQYYDRLFHQTSVRQMKLTKIHKTQISKSTALLQLRATISNKFNDGNVWQRYTNDIEMEIIQRNSILYISRLTQKRYQE